MNQRVSRLKSLALSQASMVWLPRVRKPLYSIPSPLETQPSRLKGIGPSAAIHSPLYFRATWTCVALETRQDAILFCNMHVKDDPAGLFIAVIV